MSDPTTEDLPQSSVNYITDTIEPAFLSSPEPDQQATPKTSQDTTPTSSPTSTISPKTIPSFQCTFDKCHQRFASDKDLCRHSKTHDKRLLEVNCNEPAPLGTYRCICGKRDHRLDNHKRHTKPCALKPRRGRSIGTVYQCSCGREHTCLKDHVAHLEDKILGCGRARGRRPRGRMPRSI